MIAFAIPYLQAAMGMSWAVVMCILAPCVPRLVLGKPSEQDLRTFPVFLTASAMVAGAGRWFMFNPAVQPMTAMELWFWAGTWLLSFVAAVAILVVRHVLGVR